MLKAHETFKIQISTQTDNSNLRKNVSNDKNTLREK